MSCAGDFTCNSQRLAQDAVKNSARLAQDVQTKSQFLGAGDFTSTLLLRRQMSLVTLHPAKCRAELRIAALGRESLKALAADDRPLPLGS